MEANEADLTTAPGRGAGGAALETGVHDGILEQLVVLARSAVGLADLVSVTVTDGDGFRTSNAVGAGAQALDEAQYVAGDGPCLHALRTGRQVHLPLEGDGDRWPDFRDRARSAGIGCVLSTPLARPEQDAVGALNIYARGDGEFPERDLQTAALLGEQAGMLLGNALELLTANHLNAQLLQAVASREIIGEAKGIIMERQSCTRDQAFDILRRASQRENRKLRDLAEELVLRVEARTKDGRTGQ